jgi:hypothetical protein
VTHAKLRGYAIVQNIVPSDLNLAASRELTAWFRGMRKSFRLVLFFLLLSGAILSFRAVVIYSFNQLYLASRITRKTYWFGIPTLQAPTDMWAMQEISQN